MSTFRDRVNETLRTVHDRTKIAEQRLINAGLLQQAFMGEFQPWTPEIRRTPEVLEQYYELKNTVSDPVWYENPRNLYEHEENQRYLKKYPAPNSVHAALLEAFQNG